VGSGNKFNRVFAAQFGEADEVINIKTPFEINKNYKLVDGSSSFNGKNSIFIFFLL
jgi:hypothetical protein